MIFTNIICRINLIKKVMDFQALEKKKIYITFSLLNKYFILRLDYVSYEKQN